jgi:uncharacterized protein
MDNSPHVPFFKPIIEELETKGYDIYLTGRDAFQVRELVELYGLNAYIMGKHYGKNKLLKVMGTIYRALRMIPKIIGNRPDLAISHGSRSQLVASYFLKIPSIVIFDYEYAKPLPFINPWAFLPEIIPDEMIPFKKFFKYPGIKEDVYVSNVNSSGELLKDIGFQKNDILITVRPPAVEAHYHNHRSEELFKNVMDFLVTHKNIRIVMLPRNNKQGNSIKSIWKKWFDERKIVIPEHAIDGLNLIWRSDIVISGGGTMNREAVALGVPVYSIFCGKTGAVDKYLSDKGRLKILKNSQDLQTQISLKKRVIPDKFVNNNSHTLSAIVDKIDQILEYQ